MTSHVIVTIDKYQSKKDFVILAGMMLENHLSQDLGKTNLTLLAGGAVLFNPSTQKNQTLVINEPIRLGIGTHRVSLIYICVYML